MGSKAKRFLFLAAFALALPLARGQEAVGPALFEGRGPEKAAAERAAAAQPPSLGLSLTPPVAAALPPLTADEVERLRPQRGLTPIGVHRQLPQGTVALSSAGGAARTTVAGAWQATVAGRLWRLRVTSPEARALRIHFQDFDVGAGKVWVHGADGQVAGPYGGKGMYGDGDFWSDIVSGAGATIEYLPGPQAAQAEAAPFRIAAVSHIQDIPGLFGAGGLSAQTADAASSSPEKNAASCHLDASCYSDWSGAVTSVALIVFEKDGGSGVCSGALLNDNSEGFIPYFLTAAHCINTDAAARSVIAYWRYQTATCNGNPPRLSGVPTSRGARLLAAMDGALCANDAGEGEICSWRGGDAALLRLAEGPPGGGTQYNGWTTTDPPVGGRIVQIHHPDGSFKRISFGRVESRREFFNDVSYQQGTVEPGSSGAPIFDENGRVVGVHSYGPDADVCAFPRDDRGYARFQAFYPHISRYLGGGGGNPPPPPPPPSTVTGGPLTSGRPARFSLPPVDNSSLFNGSHSYRLEVPANASRATFTLNSDDPGVDVDLYVRFGRDNAGENGDIVADYSSTSFSGNEEIVVTRSSSPPLQAGTWFVSLGLFDTGRAAEGTLTATLEFDEAPPPSPSGRPVISDGVVLSTVAPFVSTISPLALISAFGEGFAPAGTQALSPRLDSSGRVAGNLGNTCLEINGTRAPLFAVIPTQINAQAPSQQIGRADIRVIRNCGTGSRQASEPVRVEMERTSPAFFNFENNPDGRNAIVALHGGGPGLAGPPGLIPGLQLTPAEPGGVVTLLGTGFGQTDPPLETGQIPARVLPNGIANLRYDVSFTIGGVAVPADDVLYAGTAPCCAGVYQFVLRVPQRASRGAAPVMATAGGVSTPAGPFLTIGGQAGPPPPPPPFPPRNPGERFRDCAECPEMVVIPAGSFLMGSPESEGGRNRTEGPQHRVTIPAPFAVGAYEVTFEEWDACVSDGGCGGYRPNDNGWGRGRRPVIHVSWNDAAVYVTWLRGKTGKEYRLLSEAEWEYAARAGTTTRYSFGDGITPSDANYGGNIGKTQRVGSYRANGFGLYDVHGNVWEWVQDCWNWSYAGAPNNGEAWGGDCSFRVFRGGSWLGISGDLRSADRLRGRSGIRSSNVGFRVARTLRP